MTKNFGSLDRIANEVFNVNSTEGINYRIEFAINTYEKKAARLECTITGLETENYDQRLEELKIALKNRLAPDWEVCTWLVDMQSAQLCKEAYERAFIIENNLRAFASKVLIHFLGASAGDRIAAGHPSAYIDQNEPDLVPLLRGSVWRGDTFL